MFGIDENLSSKLREIRARKILHCNKHLKKSGFQVKRYRL